MGATEGASFSAAWGRMYSVTVSDPRNQPAGSQVFMAHKLVIVESPTKSRTIGGYLGDDYEVGLECGSHPRPPAAE